MPWLHTRFAIISIVLGLILLLRLMGSSEGSCADCCFPLGACCVRHCLVRVLSHRLRPLRSVRSLRCGNADERQEHSQRICRRCLFDQQFGVLPNAPVYGFCFAGLIRSGAPATAPCGRTGRRVARLPSRCIGIPYVVGRFERAGTIPRAGSPAYGSSRRLGVVLHAASGNAVCCHRCPADERDHDGRAGLGRWRCAGLQRS